MENERSVDIFGLTPEEANAMIKQVARIISNPNRKSIVGDIIRLAREESWSYEKTIAAGILIGRMV